MRLPTLADIGRAARKIYGEPEIAVYRGKIPTKFRPPVTEEEAIMREEATLTAMIYNEQVRARRYLAQQKAERDRRQ